MEFANPAATSEPQLRGRYLSQQQSDRRRAKTRINIGQAFSRWTEIKEFNGIKTHAEMATFLLDRYCCAKSSENGLEQPLERSSSTESCDSLDDQYPLARSSPNRVETSVQSSENRLEPEKEDAAVQRQKNPDKWTTENKENTEIQDEDQEFSTSLSVGDGRFLVDLGSSSEFIIDEECILQLFKSCRECSRQCTVRKTVKGLKLVVSQACCFCDSRYKWTNLPSDDDEDDVHFQMNQKIKQV